MIIIIENEIKYKLGRNAKENFELIDEANDINDNYWWFHTYDTSSGHCIVCSENIDKQMILFAGSLVKRYSKLKDDKKVKIIYTQIKNIVKAKTIGQVIVSNNPFIISI
jgi:predicted ribosome quality control (RQC) complex YloA/Tae2 family protein